MGPTNVALVKLFHADQRLREAQSRLDVATKDVRVQERRVAALTESQITSTATLRETQSKAGNLELDLRSRDEHIEKLRGRQQNSTNSKEYQALLVEINTFKVDRNKIEEETMALLEAVERGQQESKALSEHLEAESKKAIEMKTAMSGRVADLQSDIDSLRPAREEASAAVPQKSRDLFDRMADRFEGEAMAAISKPDRRREEYACTACNMDLVANIYNKLHSRDELTFCPSCSRILFIPEDLPPETAIGTGPKAKAVTVRKPRIKKVKTASTADSVEENVAGEVTIEQRAKGKLGELLAAAQGESVTQARDADQKPVDCEVHIDGELAGIYKAKSPENLERIIRFRAEEAKRPMQVRVVVISSDAPDGGESPVVADEIETIATNETGSQLTASNTD